MNRSLLFVFVPNAHYPVLGRSSGCFPGYPNWLGDSRFFYRSTTIRAQLPQLGITMKTSSFLEKNNTTHTASSREIEVAHYIPPIRHQAIALVFIADRKYLSYTSVAIHSIIEQACPNRYYDIIILHDGNISQHDMQRLQTYSTTNVSIRFFDATYYIEGYQFERFWHNRLNLMPYLKGFIPYILAEYDKAVFLDGDLIVRQDIAQLYDLDMKGHLVAAVQDWIVNYSQTVHWQKKRIYCAEQGHMQSVSNYFNSGVLLLDLKALRKLPDFQKQFIEQSLFSHPERSNHDQDSLNFILEGKTLLLPTAYNFQTALLLPQNFDSLPKPIQAQVLAQKAHPFIIHFDGDPAKPWKAAPTNLFSQLWWNLARKTPFYEELLVSLVLSAQKKATTTTGWWFYFTYYRYKVLSQITWGKKRQHYKEKRANLFTKRHPTLHKNL